MLYVRIDFTVILCLSYKKCAAPYYPEAVSTPKSQVGLLAMTWILKHFIVYMYSLCFYIYFFYLTL